MKQTEIAKLAGVSNKTVTAIKKSLNITSKELTEEESQRILEVAKNSANLMKEEQEVIQKDFRITPSVRRIDKNDNSSIADMLQDCKEQYVKNEENIQRLQYEIDSFDKLFRGSGNGYFQAIPQLTMIEKFQKLNIALRKQIAEFEEILGRIATSTEDDPFS